MSVLIVNLNGACGCNPLSTQEAVTIQLRHERGAQQGGQTFVPDNSGCKTPEGTGLTGHRRWWVRQGSMMACRRGRSLRGFGLWQECHY